MKESTGNETTLTPNTAELKMSTDATQPALYPVNLTRRFLYYLFGKYIFSNAKLENKCGDDRRNRSQVKSLLANFVS